MSNPNIYITQHDRVNKTLFVNLSGFRSEQKICILITDYDLFEDSNSLRFPYYAIINNSATSIQAGPFSNNFIDRYSYKHLIRYVIAGKILYSVYTEIIFNPTETSDNFQLDYSEDTSNLFTNGTTLYFYWVNGISDRLSDPYVEYFIYEKLAGCHLDSTAPVITLNGESLITIEQGQNWTDPGTTALDTIDGTVIPSITYKLGTVAQESFSCNSPGTWSVIYSATDSGGNTATVTRTVIVSANVLNARPVTKSDTSPPIGSCWYRAKVLYEGVPSIISNTEEVNVPALTQNTTQIELIDRAHKSAGTYFYRVVLSSGIDSIQSNVDNATLESDIYELNEFTTGFSAVATSSTVIKCELGQSTGLFGATVDWQKTTTDPDEGTSIWTTVTTTSNNSYFVTLSDLTPNVRHWFRAVLTRGDSSETSNTDYNWLSQILECASSVQSTNSIILNRGECAICLARIIHGNKVPIEPEEVTSIHYSIVKRGARLYDSNLTNVTGHQNIEVSVIPYCLRDPIVDSVYIWTVDSIGYNFIHSPSGNTNDPFPDPGFYIVQYEINLIGGQKIKTDFNINMLN